MMSSIESTSAFDSSVFLKGSRHVPSPQATRKWAVVTAVLARLRDLAPYAAMELVLPGGSLMALSLWLYRRHKGAKRNPRESHARIVRGQPTDRRADPTP